MLVAIPLSWIVMDKWREDFAYRIQLNWWIFAVACIISIAFAVVTLSFQITEAVIAKPVNRLRTE